MKIDLNVPLLDIHGEQTLRPRIDHKKTRLNDKGEIMHVPATDAEGVVIQEPVKLCEVIAQAMALVLESDPKDKVARIARGKLARKVADKTNASLKNYAPSEIDFIMERAAEVCTLEVVSQLDTIIQAGHAAEHSEVGEKVA